jgi:hypothetical protein
LNLRCLFAGSQRSVSHCISFIKCTYHHHCPKNPRYRGGILHSPLDEIEKLFFIDAINHEDTLSRVDRFVTCKNKEELSSVGMLLKDIESCFGISDHDKIESSKIFRRWNIVVEENNDWAEQLLLKMQDDLGVLEEISKRLILAGGGLSDDLFFEEAKIDNTILQSANDLQKRINQISTMSPAERIIWKNELYYFNVKAQGLDGYTKSKYMCVCETLEIDYGGRNIRELHLNKFLPII